MGSLCAQDSVKQGTTDIEFNREKGRGGGGGKSERKLKDTKKTGSQRCTMVGRGPIRRTEQGSVR